MLNIMFATKWKFELRRPMKTPISIAAAFILSGAFALAEVVFSTDFESGVPPEFSGVTSTESVQGYSQHGFSGEFLRNLTTSPQGKTTLTLTDLPDHDFVHLGFLLAIIDTWDGPESEAAGGPDWFNVTVDGTLIFSEHFQNAYGELKTIQQRLQVYCLSSRHNWVLEISVQMTRSRGSAWGTIRLSSKYPIPVQPS
jgi:hypothetical protein